MILCFGKCVAPHSKLIYSKNLILSFFFLAGSGSGAGAGHDHNISQIPQDQFDCTGRMDGYYASPTSCSSYYICVAGMALMSDCHPGLLYNEVSGYCDFPDHVTCSAQNTQPPTPAQTNPTTTTTSTTTSATTTTARVTTRTPSTTTRSTTTMKQTPPPAGGHVGKYVDLSLMHTLSARYMHRLVKAWDGCSINLQKDTFVEILSYS